MIQTKNKNRIVTTMASATEMVNALGLGEQLVGVSHECDRPEWVKSLPACTEPRVSVDQSSAAIDRSVKETLRQALSVYYVDPDQLRKLNPDVIITQTQCEVCAVSESDVAHALAHWLGKTPEIISLEPNGLADIWNDLRRIAEAFDISAQAEELIEGIQSRMDEIAKQAKQEARARRVACIEWIEPLMAAGNWIPELIENLGDQNLFGEAKKHSPWLSLQELEQTQPDALLVMPCGLDISRTQREMPALTQKPQWQSLKAVQENELYLIDGNEFMNRSSHRMDESLQILAEVLHPRVFHSPEFFKKGWMGL